MVSLYILENPSAFRNNQWLKLFVEWAPLNSRATAFILHAPVDGAMNTRSSNQIANNDRCGCTAGGLDNAGGTSHKPISRRPLNALRVRGASKCAMDQPLGGSRSRHESPKPLTQEGQMGSDTSRRIPDKSHPALTAQEAPPQTSDQVRAYLPRVTQSRLLSGR